MIKYLFLLVIISSSLFSSFLDKKYLDENLTNPNQKVKIFGYDLFNGEFKKVDNGVYNPDYAISVGDKINLNLWNNTENIKLQTVVDKKGYIFIDNFGAIRVIDVKNSELENKILKFLKRKDKSIHLYVNLETSQSIRVFLSGNVRKPGLYEGNNDDGILKYLDKAGGIKESGSFRNINILRNNKIIASYDLYDFLLNGKIKQFIFKTGDVIFVKNKDKTVVVTGDVYRPFEFEIKNERIILFLKKYAILKNSATDIVYETFDKKEKNIHKINIMSLNNNDFKLRNQDKITVLSDNYSEYMVVNIEGDVYNDKTNIFENGATLKNVIDKLELRTDSDLKNLMIFRKSVAKKQKNMLNLQLDNLEKQLRTTEYTTLAEAKIKNIEYKSLVDFIERARKVEPSGLIVLKDGTDFNNIKIEDGDTIFVPKKSNVVLIQGQVQFPSAHTFEKGKDISFYIEQAGGFSLSADKERVLVLHKNGVATTIDLDTMFSTHYEINSGDTIIVMHKIPTNNWQIWKEATEVLYHIAVSTGVLISIF